MRFLPSYSSLSSSFYCSVRGSLTTAAQRGRRSRRDGQVFEPRQLYLEDPRPAPPTPRAGRLLWLLLFNIEPESELDIPLLCFALVFLHLATHTRAVVACHSDPRSLVLCTRQLFRCPLSPSFSLLFCFAFQCAIICFFSGHSLRPWGQPWLGGDLLCAQLFKFVLRFSHCQSSAAVSCLRKPY